MGTTISISMALMERIRWPRQASLVKQLTGGNWEVGDIVGVNQVAHTVYYLSNEGDPRQQQIWVIGLGRTGQAPGEPLRRMARAGLLAQHQFLCRCRFLPPRRRRWWICAATRRDCQTIWKAPPLDAVLNAAAAPSNGRLPMAPPRSMANWCCPQARRRRRACL